MQEEIIEIIIPTSFKELPFKKFLQTQINLLEFHKSEKSALDTLTWQARDLAAVTGLSFEKIQLMPIPDIQNFINKIQWLYTPVKYEKFEVEDDLNQKAPSFEFNNQTWYLKGFSEETPYLAQLDMEKFDASAFKKKFLAKKEEERNAVDYQTLIVEELKLMPMRLAIVARLETDVYNLKFSNNLNKRAKLFEDLDVETIMKGNDFFLQRAELFTINSVSFTQVQLEVANQIQSAMQHFDNMVASAQPLDLPENGE